MDYSNAITLVGNSINFLIVYWALYILLTPKRSLPFSVALFALGFALSYIEGSLLPTASVIRYILTTVAILFPVVIVFSDPLPRKLALFLGTMVLNVFGEVFSWLVFGDDYSNPDKYIYIYFAINCFLCVMIVPYIYIINKKTKSFQSLLKTSDFALVLLLLASQVIILMSWVSILLKNGPSAITPRYIWELIIAVLFCAVADIFLVAALRRSAKATLVEVENAVLTEQVNAQQEYYSMLAVQYENIRRMRHDISNHIFTAKALINEGRLDEAQEYVSELEKANDELRVRNFCENPVVDAFLSARLRELSDKALTVKVNADVPEVVGIKNVDLITAIGNLLDNAAEACAWQENAEIDMKISHDKGYVNIRTKNPTNMHEGRPQRISGLERGVGTTILNSLAENYRGSFIGFEENGCYTAALSLKIPELMEEKGKTRGRMLR